MATLVVFGLLGILLVVFAAQGFKIVQQAETMVIERMGAYHRTLHQGINFIWPIIDQPREIEWKYIRNDLNGKILIERKIINRIDLRETVYDFPRQNVITKDNVVMEINAILYFQITHPKDVVYEIVNLPDAIEKLTQTTLRSVIGEMDLDETLSSRDTVNNKLKTILDEATDKWGVKVTRVELQDVLPPRGIKDAMEEQMRAERRKRADILNAEGERQSTILQAEGIKVAAVNKAEGAAKARILTATAEASAINTITKAISDAKGNPTQYLIAMRYLETLKEMVSGKDNKVIYLPFEASGLLASIGSMKEMFNGPVITGERHS